MFFGTIFNAVLFLIIITGRLEKGSLSKFPVSILAIRVSVFSPKSIFMVQNELLTLFVPRILLMISIIK